MTVGGHENCYKVLEDSVAVIQQQTTDDSIIGEHDGKVINKIVLHRVADKDGNDVSIGKTGSVVVQAATATAESDESMSCDSNVNVENKVSQLASYSFCSSTLIDFPPPKTVG